MVVAYGLALVSAGAIVWCAVVARPVGGAQPSVIQTRIYPWQVSSVQRQPEVERQRVATTDIQVGPATRADLAGALQGRLDERQSQVKVTITHSLRMAEADQLVLTLRQGLDLPNAVQSFTDDGFGAIKINGVALAPTTRLAPRLSTFAGLTTVEFSVTLLRQLPRGEVLQLDFNAPLAKPLLVVTRTVTLTPVGWTVTGLQGVQPDDESRRRLQFTVGPNRVKLALAPSSFGYPDAEEHDDVSWGTALGILTAIVLLVLLLRSLGTVWWQRLANRELVVGLVLAAPTLLIPLFDPALAPISYVILFLALPALAVRHAARVVPTSPPWTTNDALGVTALGVVVGFGMLSWSWLHEQLPGPVLVATALAAAVAAAGSAVAFSADLGVPMVVVRLAALWAGAAVGLLALALWTRALLTGVYPPDSVRLVLGLFWSIIPIAVVAVATKGWSRVTVLVIVMVSLLVQGWPTEWLDAGSWSLPLPETLPTIGRFELTPLMRGVFGLLLLGFVLLVLRLRRLGDSVEAADGRTAAATMIIVLMVLYLTPRGTVTVADSQVPLPLLSITSIVAWVAARWLLARTHPPFTEPATPAEHRELVRGALHRRLLQISEQELYRLGRGRLGSGEMTLADFDRRRRDLERALHSDGRENAFGTAAACSPWHNGVTAFVICLLLSLPFLLVYGWPAGPDLSSFIFDSRYLLTLPAFGFLYGYFYSRLRGTQPMTKALHLMVAALITELSGYLPTLFQPDLGALDKVQVVAIVVGEVALVSLGLGLYWEWRIMHLAGEPWGRVRNVRSIRSLATPLIAIIIAFGTAAATTAAGQTVAHILQGTTQSP